MVVMILSIYHILILFSTTYSTFVGKLEVAADVTWTKGAWIRTRTGQAI